MRGPRVRPAGNGTRTIGECRVINKPRAEIFAKIRDLRSWPEWSPWLIAEPDAKVDYSGDTSAVGGKYSWDGTVSGSAPAHRSFHVSHTGPCLHLGNAWSVAHTHTRARKLKFPKAGPFHYEVYTTEPGTTPEHEIQTDVYLTVR